MRLTVKAINDELAKRGHSVRLEKGDGYFYFSGDDAADWLDRTVKVPNVSSLTLDRWMNEFERLEKLNKEILGAPRRKEPKAEGPSAKPARRKRQT